MKYQLLSATLMALLLATGCSPSKSAPTPARQQATSPTPAHPAGEIQATPRIREELPIRLGGVYTLGLGEGSKDFEDSAGLGVKLSADNQQWIAYNCDVIALSATTITPETFPALYKTQRLITPLLYVYASSLYEQPDHKGNVGGWKPEMAAWTLRDSKGIEVPNSDRGGHWMDFGSTSWATLWRDQVLGLTRQYSAQGVVAAEMPLGNTFVGESLAKYKTPADRAQATGDWLHAARAEGKFLMIPSAVGFDDLAGHPTLPTPPGTEQPELGGRLWDEYFADTDGAWSEGWIHPYWSDSSLPENYWEIEMEAADRASRSGQVFIAAAAYHNDTELEFDLASYLLVAHRQGRLVFQPMPLMPSQPPDAGFSLAILRREVVAHPSFFNVHLGVGIQERHLVNVEGGVAWRRAFSGGLVYVNSNDRETVSVLLGGAMRRLDGTIVRHVDLPPHTGAVLLYPPKPPSKKAAKAG